jgi:hypothetical protein
MAEHPLTRRILAALAAAAVTVVGILAALLAVAGGSA